MNRFMLCSFAWFCFLSCQEAAPSKQPSAKNPDSSQQVGLNNHELHPNTGFVLLQTSGLDNETDHKVTSQIEQTPEIHLHERGFLDIILCGYGKQRKPKYKRGNSRRRGRVSPKPAPRGRSPPPGPSSPRASPPQPAAPIVPKPRTPSPDRQQMTSYGDFAEGYQPRQFPTVEIIPYEKGPLEGLADASFQFTHGTGVVG